MAKNEKYTVMRRSGQSDKTDLRRRLGGLYPLSKHSFPDILDAARVNRLQENIYLCFIDYIKAFDYVDHSKLWKILRDGNTRLPYLSPEKPVHRSRSNSYNLTFFFIVE